MISQRKYEIIFNKIQTKISNLLNSKKKKNLKYFFI